MAASSHGSVIIFIYSGSFIKFLASSIIFNILHTYMIPTITAKQAISGNDIVWYWLKYHHHWVIIMLFCQRNTDKESAIIKHWLMAKLAGHFREALHGGKGGHQHWTFTKIQPSRSIKHFRQKNTAVWVLIECYMRWSSRTQSVDFGKWMLK